MNSNQNDLSFMNFLDFMMVTMSLDQLSLILQQFAFQPCSEKAREFNVLIYSINWIIGSALQCFDSQREDEEGK